MKMVLGRHSGLDPESSLFEQLDSGIRWNEGPMYFHGKKEVMRQNDKERQMNLFGRKKTLTGLARTCG